MGSVLHLDESTPLNLPIRTVHPLDAGPPVRWALRHYDAPSYTRIPDTVNDLCRNHDPAGHTTSTGPCYGVVRWGGTAFLQSRRGVTDDHRRGRTTPPRCSRPRCAAGSSTPSRNADGAGGDPAGLTAAELAAEVGLHVTTVRFHLDQLVAAGLVESAFAARGARAGRARSTPLAPGSLDDVDPAGRARLAPHAQRPPRADPGRRVRPAPRITPAEAGRRWASEHVPARPERRTRRQPRPLAEQGRPDDRCPPGWGYTPELTTTGGGRTARSPWRTAPSSTWPAANTAVVCGIHRGLIVGSLRAVRRDRDRGRASSPSSAPPPVSRT